MRQPIYIFSIVSFVSLYLIACGHRSSSDEGGGGGGFSGNLQNVTGTVTSQSGSPAEMRGWLVALMERDSRVARTAVADVAGILKWNKVSLDVPQTAVLLSPDYLLQSIMSLPSSKTNTVKQYFQINSKVLPQLVQKGSGLSFQTMTGVTVQDYFASDSDADGNPDGAASFSLASAPMRLATVDTDRDGVPNELDGDIDGDGLLNAYDGDDDGDGAADVFDPDANGNLIADTQEANGESYYSQGIEYFAVRYEQGPTNNSMQFSLKVLDGLSPESVKIRTAASLTDSSLAVSQAGDTSNWDLTLSDDGSSFDGASKDLLYAKKVQLASGKAPRVNQVLFAQVTFGTGDSAFTVEYPWMFPNLTLSGITTSYDTASRVVTLSGDPFGSSNQTFLWSVTLTNSDGIKIYASSATSGTTRTITIPSNVLQSGQTYTYQAIAQTRDTVPGGPVAAVRSATATIHN